MSVNHVTGAIGCGIVKGQGKDISIGAEFMNGIQSRSCQILSGPLLEIDHLAQEFTAVISMINIPDLLLDILVERFVPFLGAVSNFEKGMEEALKDRDGCEKRLPGLLGW